MTEEKRREVLDDLTSFLNVHDDGTLNEVVNEERTQLERMEVEDEKVKRDPLMELMEMKWKQREQRKRYREKHPEIFQEQKRRYRKKHPEVIRDHNRRYRQKNREKLTEIKRKKYREAHPEGACKHQKTGFAQFHNRCSKHYIHLYPVVCNNTLSSLYILFHQHTDVKFMYQLIVYYHSF